jgi:hypothetical protein
MSQNGTFTKDGGIAACIGFYDVTATLWAAIGRTTAWSDDGTPPAEDSTVTVIDEIIGFKRILQKLLVTPDPLGTIIYTDQNYRVVPRAQAFDQEVVDLHLEASFDGAELPLTTFRQVGIYEGLLPATGFEQALVLLPAQVASPGRLIWYRNMTPQTRTATYANVFRRVFRFIPSTPPPPIED